jgi:hypothetical protein
MGTIPPPHDALWSVVDATARVVVLREAIADGRLDEADAIGERLELDLIAVRVLLEEQDA